MVHTLIACGPVDRLNTIISPLSLMIYCFILDWQLGLLSVGTIPLLFTSLQLVNKRHGQKQLLWTALMLGSLPIWIVNVAEH